MTEHMLFLETKRHRTRTFLPLVNQAEKSSSDNLSILNFHLEITIHDDKTWDQRDWETF